MALRRIPSGPSRAGVAAGRARGFTLIEVLVAFTIMALVLGALLQSFATGLRNLGAAQSYAGAALRARSMLAELSQTVPLEAGEQSGQLDGGLEWRAVVEPYAPAVPEGIPGGPLLAGYRVEITVSWAAGRAVSLTTMRLARQR